MNRGFLARLRANHALEHATIAMLRGQGVSTRLVGRATAGGFYVYGDVPTRAVEEAAGEGLTRLQQGQGDLAISPLCGTNAVVAGVLAGLASLIAMGGEKDRISKTPRVILAALTAVVVSQPLGGLVQRHLTTTHEVSGLRISGVRRKGKGTRTRHQIQTAWEEGE